jgi:hypothetical protein
MKMAWSWHKRARRLDVFIVGGGTCVMHATAVRMNSASVGFGDVQRCDRIISEDGPTSK